MSAANKNLLALTKQVGHLNKAGHIFDEQTW